MPILPRPIVSEPQPAALAGWLRRAHEVLASSAAAIDAINVFPAPDADTGTNVTLTLAGVLDAQAGPGWAGSGRAAVVSAHGNSGAVIGQMIAIAIDRLAGPAATEPCGRWLAGTLRAAADAATAAIADPVQGTVLTVAAAAADAAAAAAGRNPADGLEVARAARHGAAVALRRTTEQLAPLRAAGVVDAGGQAYLLLLDVLVETLGGEPARPLDPPPADALPVAAAALPEAAAGEAGHEVMYVVTGADRAGTDRLRARLSEVADSVVVVTDPTVHAARTVPPAPGSPGATAQVHAHLTRPELAIAPGLETGPVSALRITPLRIPPRAGDPAGPPRRPLVLLDDEALAGLVRTHGGTPILPAADGPLGRARLAAAVAAADRPVLAVTTPRTEPELQAAVAACVDVPRVERIPVDHVVQALCALAVHEPTTDPATAARAMRAAAARVRAGTAAGVEDGWRLVRALGVVGAELVTIVAGPAGTEAAAELGRRIGELDPRVEIEVVAGGQAGPELLIGVEA